MPLALSEWYVPDGKIDLRPDAAGYERVRPLADQIMAALAGAGDAILP
jgi:hypothetical protein